MRFDLPGDGNALFTTRAHGNLSSVGGDGAEHGLEARERLREQLGVRRLIRGYQVHGTTIQRVGGGVGGEGRRGVRAAEESGPAGKVNRPPDSESQPEIEADGQATAINGLGAMVLTADCLPVALGASGAVAMVHAGWRGLAAGVLEESVRALRELVDVHTHGGAGEDDGKLVAIIGPGAGPCCYEVGDEVHAAFGGDRRMESPPTRNIDLKAIARDRLLRAGVTEVHVLDVCTICDERFFSYRREGARAGRQGGVAWLSR
jgi:YfiH family protein